MNNSWNKIIYKIASPIYDRFFKSGIFLRGRKQIFQDITFHKRQKILFVGVGTGADLELINHHLFLLHTYGVIQACIGKVLEKTFN